MWTFWKQPSSWKNSLCWQLGITVHSLRRLREQKSQWGVKCTTESQNPVICGLHSENNVCNVCIGSYGTLEVAGVMVLVAILGLKWLLEIPENMSVFVMCFSLELENSFLIIFLLNSEAPCEIWYFWKDIYLFSFHPPTSRFCFASGFLVVYSVFKCKHLTGSWSQ